MSKGEERRRQQEEDIEGILVKNCPDLLRNFGNDNDLTLEDLSINDEGKKKKAKKEKKQKKDKSKFGNTSVIKQEPGITQPPLFSLPPFPPSTQAFPSSPFSPLASLQPQFPLPSSLPPAPPPLPTDPSSPLPPELHSLLISWYMAGKPIRADLSRPIRASYYRLPHRIVSRSQPGETQKKDEEIIYLASIYIRQ